MKICIIGGSGFIGKYLSQTLLRRGDCVVLLTRSTSREEKDALLQTLTANISMASHQQCLILSYSPSNFPKIGGVDALINLAGAPISKHRWTALEKKNLLDSRILTTKMLLTAVSAGKIAPKIFISGSAIGYYGHRKETPLMEDMDAGEGFLAKLALDWEDVALTGAGELNLPTAIIRTGIVLGHGGFLEKIIQSSPLGIYTLFGAGNAYLPWIHIHDLIRAILYLIDMNLTGVFNLCAPNPVTYKTFTLTLKELRRGKWLVRIPEGLVYKIFGEFSELFLFSQNAKPYNLLENGFTFQYKKLSDALSDLIKTF